MSVYFCLDDLLEILPGQESGKPLSETFVPVTADTPPCCRYKEDALRLAGHPKLLDLNEHKGIYQFTALIDDVPLYQINLELLLDRALVERHSSEAVDRALRGAFEGNPLPNTLEKEKTESAALDGSLSHPMLGHLDKAVLCKIYVNFMRRLSAGHNEYSFARNIVGQHPGPFRSRFNGYIFGAGGEVRADILIEYGTRADFDPRRQIENYVENGRATATMMRIRKAHEFLKAWLDADHYQMRRCHDIDRVLLLEDLPGIPNWVRADIFNGLEKEAMKQVLAMRLIEEDPGLLLLSAHPAIRKAVEDSAQGRIDDNLQYLMAQTLTADTAYAGAADRFYKRAQERAREAETLGLPA